jgi:RNA polymerase-interacting CarD/CdnL/TRCF family regulator
MGRRRGHPQSAATRAKISAKLKAFHHQRRHTSQAPSSSFYRQRRSTSRLTNAQKAENVHRSLMRNAHKLTPSERNRRMAVHARLISGSKVG